MWSCDSMAGLSPCRKVEDRSRADFRECCTIIEITAEEHQVGGRLHFVDRWHKRADLGSFP